MAESADALDSGSSRGNSVEVQVLLSAPEKSIGKSRCFFNEIVSYGTSEIFEHSFIRFLLLSTGVLCQLYQRFKEFIQPWLGLTPAL